MWVNNVTLFEKAEIFLTGQWEVLEQGK
jgi:hypothetical protein